MNENHIIKNSIISLNQKSNPNTWVTNYDKQRINQLNFNKIEQTKKKIANNNNPQNTVNNPEPQKENAQNASTNLKKKWSATKLGLYTHKQKEFLLFAMSWLFVIDNLKIKLRKGWENQMKKLDQILLVMYFIGFITNVTQDILYFKFETIRTLNTVSIVIHGEPTLAIQIIRSVTTLTTVIIILLLPIHFKIYKYLLIIKSEIHFDCSLWSWNFLPKIIFIYLLSIFHVPPFLDGFYVTIKTMDVIQISVKVDIILFLNVWISWRWILLVFYFSLYSSFADDRADKICEESNVQRGFFFSLRSQIKEQPMLTIAFQFVISIFLFGYMLRNTELAFMIDAPINNFQDWTQIWNGFWCVLMGFFTIGFGDYYPQTNFGRIVMMLASWWGLFLVGLFVIHVSTLFVFTPHERKIYDEVIEDLKIAKRKKQGLKVIYSYYKVYLEQKQCELARNSVQSIVSELPKVSPKLYEKLMHEVVEFKNWRKYYHDNSQVQIQRLWEKLNYTWEKSFDDIIDKTQNEIDLTTMNIKTAKMTQIKIQKFVNTIQKLTQHLYDSIEE